MIATIPPFNCVEHCQAPDEFFSGGPWVYHPKDRILQLRKDENGFVEWQIWEGISGNSTDSYKIEIDGHTIFEVNTRPPHTNQFILSTTLGAISEPLITLLLIRTMLCSEGLLT